MERIKLTKSKVEVKIHIDATLNAEQKRLLINQNELNALDILAANSDDGLRLILDLKAPTTLTESAELVTRQHYNDVRINNLSRKSDNSRPLNKPVSNSKAVYPTTKFGLPTFTSISNAKLSCQQLLCT